MKSARTAAVPSHLLRQALLLHDTAILPDLFESGSRHNSPCEDALHFCLATILAGDIRRGSLTLARHKVVESDSFSARYYEIDLYLHQVATGVGLGVEADGWRYHGQTPGRFDYFLRRSEEIRCAGYDLLHLSSRTIMRSPWSAALRVIRYMNRPGSPASPIVLSDGVHRVLAELVPKALRIRSATAVVGGQPGAAPVDLPPGWSAVASRIAALPRTATVSQSEHRVRSRHPRAFERWTTYEIEQAKRALQDGLSPIQIAAVVQRQPGAVTRRLREVGLACDRNVPDAVHDPAWSTGTTG